MSERFFKLNKNDELIVEKMINLLCKTEDRSIMVLLTFLDKIISIIAENESNNSFGNSPSNVLSCNFKDYSDALKLVITKDMQWKEAFTYAILKNIGYYEV